MQQRSDGSEPSALVATLLREHATIRRLLDELEHTARDRSRPAMRRLVAALAAHEKAEEEVVFPALSACAAGGAAIAEDRVAEQLAAEHHLQDVESAGVDDRWFPAAYGALRREVLAHAEAEERTVFWVLDANLGRRELDRLHQRYVRARRRAPTHPHPLSPHKSPLTRVAAPVAGIADRVGDSLTSLMPGRRSGGV